MPVLGERTDGPEHCAKIVSALDDFQLRGSSLAAPGPGGSKDFTFDVYSWGSHSYKPRPEKERRPLDIDPTLTRSYHGGSGLYMLERKGADLGSSLGSSQFNLTAPLAGLSGLGSSLPTGDGRPKSVGASPAGQPAHPPGVGLASSMRDSATAARMGASIRARSVSPHALASTSMPMPLPSTLPAAVGGGMLNRHRLTRTQRGGGFGSRAQASAARSSAEWRGASSSSTKDRVFNSLRAVRSRS